ncbi:MAG: hypothetical protein ACLQRH_00855 [Acidimicrobiales bacterium]
MTWEKATRRISLGASCPIWSQFQQKIDVLAGGGPVGRSAEGLTGGGLMTDRVGEVVSSGSCCDPLADPIRSSR